MTKRNGTSVQVHLVLAEVEQLHVGQSDNRESLVDLKSINSALFDASVLESLGDGKRGRGSELGGVLCSITPAKNLSNGLQVVLLESGFGDEDKGSSAIGQGRGISSGHGTVVGLEGGTESAGLGFVELGRISDGPRLDLMARRMIRIDHSLHQAGRSYVLRLVILVNDFVGLAAATGDLDGSNLFLEPASLDGGDSLLVGANAVLVLLLTVEAMVAGALLSLQSHVLLLVCIGEAILQHAVDKGLVAKLCTVAEVREVVRGVGHALGTASDDDVGISGDDGLGTDDEGLDGRGADLVEGGANNGFGQSSTQGALAGRVLAETGETLSDAPSAHGPRPYGCLLTWRTGRCP